MSVEPVIREAKNGLLINVAVSEYDSDKVKDLNNSDDIDFFTKYFKSSFKIINQNIYESQQGSTDSEEFWDLLRDARTEINMKPIDLLIISFSGYTSSSNLILSDYNDNDEGEIAIKEVQKFFEGKNVPKDFLDEPKYLILSSWRNGNKFNIKNENHIKSLSKLDIANDDNNSNLNDGNDDEKKNDDKPKRGSGKGSINAAKKQQMLQVASDQLLHFLQKGSKDFSKEYYEVMKKNEFITYKKIKTMTDKDLVSMQVKPPHRKKLVKRIKTY